MKQIERTPEKRQEIVKAEPVRTPGLFEEMEHLFDSFLGRTVLQPWRADWASFPDVGMRPPRVDVIERDEEILVEAEIPGVAKDALDVEVDDDTVTIRGLREHEEKEEEGSYFRSEIRRGAFSRTITLPAEVDGSKAKAVFQDGMLRLTLPRVEKAKRHTIKVE